VPCKEATALRQLLHGRAQQLTITLLEGSSIAELPIEIYVYPNKN